MNDKIIFCICTKNRKLKLIKNLTSILRLKNFSMFNVEIILIVNDKSSYSDLIDKFNKNLNIKFYREYFSGVTFSRNKILEILRKKKI